MVSLTFSISAWAPARLFRFLHKQFKQKTVSLCETRGFTFYLNLTFQKKKINLLIKRKLAFEKYSPDIQPWLKWSPLNVVQLCQLSRLCIQKTKIFLKKEMPLPYHCLEPMQLKVYNKHRSTCYINYSPPSAQFWPPLRSQEMPGVRQQVQCSTNIQNHSCK